MTYFGFLGLFLILPIGAVVGVLALRRREALLPERLRAVPPATAIAITAVVAVAYTTPWDNYLVATGVWSYDPALVSGVILGYVPLEEYLFFILQTVLTGLWLILRSQSSPDPAEPQDGRVRRWAFVPVFVLWITACAGLASAWGPARYTVLLLAWALPPVLLQLAYGADLLWKERRLVLPAIGVATLYYAAADVIAVGSGTWGFHPDLTLGIHLGPLPLEEILFFLLTNILIVFSVTLLMSKAGMERYRILSDRARSVLRPKR